MEPNSQDSQRRLMLALGISLVLWMVYMTFFAPKPSQEQLLAGARDGGATQVTQAAPVEAAAGADAGVAIATGPEAAPEGPQPELKELEVRTESTRYGLSTDGAGLVRAELQGSKMREQQRLTIAEGYRRAFGGEVPEPVQMDMGRPIPGAPRPLAVSIEGARPFTAQARYALEEDAQAGTMTFTARQGSTEIVKVLQLARSGFEGAMTVTVRNRGAEALGGELGVHYARAVEPGSEEKGSFFGGVGNESFSVCSIGEKLHKLVPGGKNATEVHQGGIEYFGVDQQYFVGALFPLEGAREGKCSLLASPSGRAVVALFPLAVPPGQEATYKFGLFVGPKDGELLEQVPDRMLALGLAQQTVKQGGWAQGFQGSRYPHLERTIDLGIWAFLCKILLVIMKWFHGVFGNWGAAVILLTVTVKLFLLPLTHKSMVSAENMKKLQPRMTEIRQKFADDKNRQNLEMMKLYQEAKVNPFGACLPLLLQMPVWIALFQTLRNSYDIYREPFLSPIWLDLTYKDPTYLLPLALGATMIVTQKLQPQMVDPVQAKMMTYVMPVFFTAIMLNYPAGLSLYILTNNILSIGQQYALRKYLEKKGIAAPRPPGPPGAKPAKRERATSAR